LTGDHPFDSDLGAEMGCATAFSTMPGAYTAFTPTEDGEIAIRIAFPELDPGIPAAATPQPVRIDLADGTQFSPMGCMGDVTQNALDEATPDGDIYRVSGEGSCDAPGVSGDRSIEVVGTFRFVALIRWQN
jgi:hypothetical protein